MSSLQKDRRNSYRITAVLLLPFAALKNTVAIQSCIFSVFGRSFFAPFSECFGVVTAACEPYGVGEFYIKRTAVIRI
jgi:hypothetical protein